MRQAARTDANQTKIVKALRNRGWGVALLADQGKGVPDLLVGGFGVTVLLEIKDGSKPPSQRCLTAAQKEWHRKWQGGGLYVVHTLDEAVAACEDTLSRVEQGLTGSGAAPSMNASPSEGV